MILRQMEAADRLESIRDEYNLTETDPISELVLDV